MPRHILTGQTFGRLTVQPEHRLGSRGRIIWRCICACGTEKWVAASALKLPQHKLGTTKSCGCLNRELNSVRHQPGRLIGNRTSPEYRSWDAMKQRCTNPKHRAYRNYGGRGIKVCDRWLNFENFLQDMRDKPTEKHTLERMDSNGDYTPDNCTLATRAVQNRNHSRNRYIEFQGERMCITDWAARLGINQQTLRGRLKTWPVERALSEPLQAAKSR
jgi:hypothetical protein